MMYGNFTERELDAFWIGTETEKTRIIKLLEAESPCQMKGMHHDIGFCSCQAIALIKGEK